MDLVTQAEPRWRNRRNRRKIEGRAALISLCPLCFTINPDLYCTGPGSKVLKFMSFLSFWSLSLTDVFKSGNCTPDSLCSRKCLFLRLRRFHLCCHFIAYLRNSSFMYPSLFKDVLSSWPGQVPGMTSLEMKSSKEMPQTRAQREKFRESSS